MTTSTPYASVRRATDADETTVLTILTEAFLADPLTCWLFPDERDRAALQLLFHRPQLADPTAEVELIDAGGVALWHTVPADRPAHEGADDDQSAQPGPNTARLRALGLALAPRHPRGRTHLYLVCIGVPADRQGAGLGSALLRHRLERADADGTPAYLEASSPGSRALYQRHGFTDLGEPVRPAADCPLLWPMWREPLG